MYNINDIGLDNELTGGDSGGGGSYTPPATTSVTTSANSNTKILPSVNYLMVDKHAFKDTFSTGAKHLSLHDKKIMYFPGAVYLDLNQPQTSIWRHQSLTVYGADRDTLVLSNNILTSIQITQQEDPTQPPVIVPPPVIPPPVIYAFVRLENLSNQDLNANGKIMGDVVFYFCSTPYFDSNKLINSGNLTINMNEDSLINGVVTGTYAAQFQVSNVTRAVIYPDTRIALNSFGTRKRSVYRIVAGSGYSVGS